MCSQLAQGRERSAYTVTYQYNSVANLDIGANAPFLSDSSKHTYNLTAYHDNELFQVRLAYN